MENQSTQQSTIYTHRHLGTDSQQIELQSIKGWDFRIVTSATTTPSDTPPNGSIRFLSDGTNYVMWVRIGGLWKKTTLS